MYDWNYFNSYQGSGFYWNYPSNEIIFNKVMERAPKSVLELGCARGYILKKIQDTGRVKVRGLDCSEHAWLTRVCDPIYKSNLCLPYWQAEEGEFDLAFSLNLLEHIPERHLPTFMKELERVSSRGLHAVAVQGGEPNADRTRCTLKPLEFWKKILPARHEIFDCREFGSGGLSQEYLKGDGRLKLNVGCAWTMFHQGWTNIDLIDAKGYAQGFGYNFVQHDVRNGLSFLNTGIADAIFHSHFLEHLSYEEGLRFLRECRRVIRPSGSMRIVVPDTETLLKAYENDLLFQFDEANEGCSNQSERAGKLWNLLGEGHRAFYDQKTLSALLLEAGWQPHSTTFRLTSVPGNEQILRETLEMSYGFSLFMDATPI